MKRALLLLTACILLLAAPGMAATEPTPGIIMAGVTIVPGDPVQTVWGAAGFPDEVHAMRSKEQKGDYVTFRYISWGLLIDVNSQSNHIQGILISDNKTKTKNVPLRIGEASSKAQQMWGQPENYQNGVMAYWRKGIYLTVDSKGLIENIFLVKPGNPNNP